MAQLTTTAARMVAEARARIEEIGAAELVAMHADPDLVIVDIRDVRELEREGVIPGSVHAPRGMLEFWVDPECKYHKPVFDQPGKRFVLHCASGWRSALAVATLTDMGFACAHLRDGFTGWREAGGPIQKLGPWR